MNSQFPEKIPVFPLSGVIYFPNTNLPLNVFEDRYLSLVNDVIKTNKLMGMVQSIKGKKDVYNVGCLGKISDFRKSDDGRILLNLTGITRFEIKKEIETTKLYREFFVDYKKFTNDIDVPNKVRTKSKEFDLLDEKMKIFFKKNGILLNWKEFEILEDEQKINTLSMIAPISNEEKQKLLETVTLKNKIKTLLDITNFYIYGKNSENLTVQ
jgi:Lon protease-like protein|tara:strand:- start:642 stop:1274 length:633 start_codon:yes stop_codon:yes gene_type:complete